MSARCTQLKGAFALQLWTLLGGYDFNTLSKQQLKVALALTHIHPCAVVDPALASFRMRW